MGLSSAPCHAMLWAGARSPAAVFPEAAGALSPFPSSIAADGRRRL